MDILDLDKLVPLDRLTTWMDDLRLETGPIVQVTRLTGGTQNILLHFLRGNRAFVLRRPPMHTHANSNRTIRREARVLAALAQTPVPHPSLIASCADETVLGAAFYLMEPVEGFNATVNLPALHAGDPMIRREMGFALIDGIRALGQVDARALGLGDLGKAEGFLERQVPRWKAQLDTYAEHEGWAGPAALPGIEEIGSWLSERCPTNYLPGILHGDYHLANVMYRNDGPSLAAIVDWELTTLGDPLLDLGWVLCGWPNESGPQSGDIGVRPWSGFPTAGELVARYATDTVRDMSNLRWYAVLACYKLALILEGTNARAAAGKADRATGDQLHNQAVSLLNRAQIWMETQPAYFER